MDYTIHLTEDVLGEGYIATCDEVPGALAYGLGVVEAVQAMADELYLRLTPDEAGR